MRKLSAIAFAAILVLSLGGPALAKGGGNGGNSPAPASIALVQPPMAAPTTTATWPVLGQQVNFVWSASVRDPRIELLCYQPEDPSGMAMYVDDWGYLVYGEARGATPDQGDYVGTHPFVLGGGMSAWLLDGGSASCVANLFYFGKQAGLQTFNVIASTPPFIAGG